jgi:hypothetical protein
MPAAFMLVRNGRRRSLPVDMEIAAMVFNPLDGGSVSAASVPMKGASRHWPFAFNTSNTAAVS